jgi:hypothetical protein
MRGTGGTLIGLRKVTETVATRRCSTRERLLFVKFLVDSERLLVRGWKAEDAEDSALVNDTYLDVRFIVESRAFVELSALDKQGPHRLVGLNGWFGFRHPPAGAVKMSNHCTV